MSYRNILVNVGDDERNEPRLRLAASLTAEFDAHLTGLFVYPPLIVPAAYGNPAAMLGAEVIEAQREVSAARGEAAEKAFEAAAGSLSQPTEFETAEGDPGEVIGLNARYFDLTVLSQTESGGFSAIAEQLAERVVLASGRPVLIMPYAGDFPTVGRNVVVAWNETRESARAVNDALPFIERADKVTVLQIDPPDGQGTAATELARRLAHHDVRAEAQHTVSGGVAAGEILLSMVADLDADLLVMGAYGHSRVRELTLGGVTRSVIAHMTLPVMMSY